MQHDIGNCLSLGTWRSFLMHICTASTYFDLFIHAFLGTWLDVEALATALALTGKASVVSCFCIIFIYSSELFPTVIRTVGMGCCAFWGRVGSLLAPQILLLVSISTNFTYCTFIIAIYHQSLLDWSLLRLIDWIENFAAAAIIAHERHQSYFLYLKKSTFVMNEKGRKLFCVL